ncbi:MAG: hypothetical protein UT50_C0008G0021 [Candidatus Moranbacteria bacterium GW2011_GWA2_39_41]|nr:MAG: hypothetical protein UT50_C0008G0021 [Candidatus Moranbacteria bacterium GW2011_GWA2_39_41]
MDEFVNLIRLFGAESVCIARIALGTKTTANELEKFIRREKLSPEN